MVSSSVSDSLRAAAVAVALSCVVLLPACTSSPKPTANAPRFGAVPVEADAKSLVGVWTIDVDATIAGLGSGEEPAGVRTKLGQMSTQLGLFADGVFILKNLGADARGMITVEGTWSFDGEQVVLVGHLENGLAPAIRKNVRYRLDQNRLVRVRDAIDGAVDRTVYPMLKKSFDA